MSIIEKLKQESLRIRRDKGVLAAFSVFALSEVMKVGKNAGNRETIEDEAIAVIKKMISTIQSNLDVVKDEGNIAKFRSEKELLERVLPTMVADDEVRMFLVAEFGNVKPTKGDIMKKTKAKFGSLVDMKKVSEISMEMYNV